MLAGICCILDSRGNQHDALVESIQRNKCFNTELFIYSEKQDKPTTERYQIAYQQFKNDKFKAYMFMASDITIETEEFDKNVLDIIDDLEKRHGHRKWVLYPDDGCQGKGLATHPIFTTEWLDAIGYFFPTGYMKHLYVDNYIMDVATYTGKLVYCPDLKLNHNHPIFNKGEWDEHYKKAYERDAEDKEQYFKLREKRFFHDIGKVK